MELLRIAMRATCHQGEGSLQLGRIRKRNKIKMNIIYDNEWKGILLLLYVSFMFEGNSDEIVHC